MSKPRSSPQTEFLPQNSDLWQLYVQTYSSITSYLDRMLRTQANIKLDDFHILSALTRNQAQNESPRVIRMGEIATVLNASPSRLTYQIERLIGLGWVERTSVKEDRRGKGVFITELGKQRYEEALRVHSNFMDTAVMANVSDEEVESLKSVMGRMLQAVSIH